MNRGKRYEKHSLAGLRERFLISLFFFLCMNMLAFSHSCILRVRLFYTPFSSFVFFYVEKYKMGKMEG